MLPGLPLNMPGHVASRTLTLSAALDKIVSTTEKASGPKEITLEDAS